MNSIYDKTSNEAIISRINKLTENTSAEWGKMTVDQMFKHCTAAIEIAYGEKEIKVNLMMKILGKLVKNKIFNSDFQRNSPTAQEFVFADKFFHHLSCARSLFSKNKRFIINSCFII